MSQESRSAAKRKRRQEQADEASSKRQRQEKDDPAIGKQVALKTLSTTDLASTPTTAEIEEKRLKRKAEKKERKRVARRKGPTPPPPPPGWALSARAGGRFIDQDAVFLEGGYLLTAQGDVAQVLSTTDSSVIKSLPGKGKKIVSLHAVSTLVRVLYDDQTLVDWDWESGSSDQSRLAAKADIYRMSSNGSRIVSVYTTWDHRAGIAQVLLDGRPIHTLPEKIIDIRVLHGGDIIAVICKRSLVIGGKGDTWTEYKLQQDAVCFDVRQIEADAVVLSVAIGYSDGKIHLHGNVSGTKLNAPRILHWHRNAVNAVKFAGPGYLISGGKETVLTIWQLETGQKSFLPNLTGEIERLVVNNPVADRYAVQLGDNSIIVLSTSELKPVAYFAGLQINDGDNEQKALAATLHPIRHNELLVTVSATRAEEHRPFLQTFSPASSTRQALARNNVTDLNTTPDSTTVLPPDVNLIAVSVDGKWLASIDEWSEPDNEAEHREVYLKFWQWHTGTAKWQLNSRIDAPHGSDGVVFRLLPLSSNGFVTVGQDSRVKTWTPRSRMRNGEPVLVNGEAQIEWVRQSCIELESQPTDLENNELTGAALAVSGDSSLIAVALRSLESETVQFFDRSGKVQIGATVNGLVDLAFADRYLITISNDTIRMWDVVEDVLYYKMIFSEGQGQEPRLAVNRGIAAVAAGETIRVYSVQPAKLLKTLSTTGVGVVAIIARPKEAGFTLVYNDATTGTLTISGADTPVSNALFALPAAGAIETKPTLTFDSVITKDRRVEPGSAEDDRRIVRPEQLAEVFDKPLGIRDMFDAVVGLFGRKPRAAFLAPA